MDPERPEAATAGADASEAGPSDPAPDPAPADPASLVDRLIQAGDWPDPDLIDRIATAGEAALGPLLGFIRTYPTDDPREMALYNGLTVLGALKPPAAIPVLAEVIRRYPEDTGELAAQVLGEYGAPVFETLLDLVRDPEVKGYRRSHAIDAARQAAGTDPALRARLADVLRPLLADAMDRTREEDRKAAQEADEPEDEDEESPGGWVLEDLEEDEEVEEEGEEGLPEGGEPAGSGGFRDLEPYEEVMFRVGDLAALADPQARDLIKTAFAEGLVDTFWIDEKYVDERYREGGDEPRPPRDWLGEYRDRYGEHMRREELRKAPRAPQPPASFSPGYREPASEPAPPQPPETIRNTGPKLGRNDPCWCGSGKKYKKCHWSKDERE